VQTALAPHVPRLLEWLSGLSELPPAMRTRISPGNVSALLLTLAQAGAGSSEDRQRIVDLAWRARARHGVEPPLSIRASAFPAPVKVSAPPPPPRPTSTPPLQSAPPTETEAPKPKRKRKAKAAESKPKRASRAKRAKRPSSDEDR